MGKRDIEVKSQTPKTDTEVQDKAIETSTEVDTTIDSVEVGTNVAMSPNASIRLNQDIEVKSEPNIIGTVIDCWMLNVREEPRSDANILGTVNQLSQVMIDIGKSTESYYKVCTASGVEGFCLKNYITTK